MHVVFRYDDYSAAEQYPYEVDEALFDLFLALDVPLLVAVTPRMSAAIRDPLNQRFFAIEDDTRRIRLLARGLDLGWQLALHGYTHQSSSDLSGTEFYGVSQEMQEAAILAGRRVLTACFPGAPLDVFVPPWNSYNDATVQSLARHGFRALCAGDTELERQEHNVTIVPSLMTPRDLLDYVESFSLDDLIEEVGAGCLVITMHQYEFCSQGRNDYVALDELAHGIRRLLEAGVKPGIFDVQAPVGHYNLRNRMRFKAKIHLLQQVRNRRAMGLWTFATLLGRPLGPDGALVVKTGAAQVRWRLDQTEHQLRSRLRPVKRWIMHQGHNRRYLDLL